MKTKEKTVQKNVERHFEFRNAYHDNLDIDLGNKLVDVIAGLKQTERKHNLKEVIPSSLSGLLRNIHDNFRLGSDGYFVNGFNEKGFVGVVKCDLDDKDGSKLLQFEVVSGLLSGHVFTLYRSNFDDVDENINIPVFYEYDPRFKIATISTD